MTGGDYLIPSHHDPLKMKRVVSFHGSIPDRLVKGQYRRRAAGGDVEQSLHLRWFFYTLTTADVLKRTAPHHQLQRVARGEVGGVHLLPHSQNNMQINLVD